jgi:adenine phosphoribosyltransferase
MNLEVLKKSSLEAPIVKKGDYYYVVHPITDGVPYITPELLTEVTQAMIPLIQKCGNIDRIVTMEAMGIPLAAVLSLDLDIPFTIIRKREYGLPGEISVEKVTEYSKSKMYINGLKKGDKIIIVDDVISSGGTLKAVLTVLKKMRVDIKGVFIAIDRGSHAKEISSKFGIPITSLINFQFVDGKIIIKKNNTHIDKINSDKIL